MKTKIILAFIFFSLIFIKINAQNISVGVRGGITIPNLSGDQNNPLQKGYSSRKGIGYGVFAEFKISNLFSIQPMIEYSQQGAKSKGAQAIPYDATQNTDEFNELIQYLSNGNVPTYLYANFNVQAKLNYLVLPVLAKFGWNLGHQSRWRIYFDAGPFAGILLNANQITNGGETDLYLDADEKNIVYNPLDNSSLQFNFDTTNSIKNSLHKYNFGLEGNLGFAYKFKRNTVFIEGGGNYSLINIQRYPKQDGKNHSGAVTVMIGYAITL